MEIIHWLSNHEPVMAHYSDSKVTNYDYSVLVKVRKDGLKAIEDAEEVYVIGVRLPDEGTDDFVSNVFEKLKSIKTIYINPSREDIKRFSDKYSNAKVIRNSMSEWVSGKS